MDINKIEMILFALHSGSFSKAAEKYSYTPSALSHIADSLEGEIGRKFIRRTHMGIEPADPEIVAALQDICDDRDRFQPAGTGGFQMQIVTGLPADGGIDRKLVTAAVDGNFVVAVITGDQSMDLELAVKFIQIADVVDRFLEFTDEAGGKRTEFHSAAAQFPHDEKVV